MGYCCASKVKMYWALSLPWTVQTHEALRDAFIREQLWAVRRVERFGYSFIEHVYCHSDHVVDPDAGSLPLFHVSIEVDPLDFESRCLIHIERAANLSDNLLGTQVEFRPRWGGEHVTQIISAHSERKLDGSVAINQQMVFVHNRPFAIDPNSQSCVKQLTRKHAALSVDNFVDAASFSVWSDMHFDRSVNAASLFSQAKREVLCLPVMGLTPPCVHANVTLANCAVLVPVFGVDGPDAVVDRIMSVRGNLRCLRGGEKEVRAFIAVKAVQKGLLPKSFRYEG
ncbi:MAG: hypothetical protein PHD48_08615 [Alphaproteobacteria bacterium]|nr:hypothetical protein [Alphaproteobacteria bacterium]